MYDACTFFFLWNSTIELLRYKLVYRKIGINISKQSYVLSFFFLFFFLITHSIRASLRAPQIIFKPTKHPTRLINMKGTIKMTCMQKNKKIKPRCSSIFSLLPRYGALCRCELSFDQVCSYLTNHTKISLNCEKG